MKLWPSADKAKTIPAELFCAFCKKSQKQVRKLISGPDKALICDECIGLCNDILAEKTEEEAVQARPELPADAAAILRHLDTQVVGLQAAKRALSAALYTQLLRINRPGRPLRPAKVLVVGPRGCGKSELVRALLSFAPKLVSYNADASRLTKTGYIGENVENLLAAMRDATEHPSLAWDGLLIIDGLHHVAAQRPAIDSPRDISGAEVQRDLMRIFDGQPCLIPYGNSIPRHPHAGTEPFPCAGLLIAATATLNLDGIATDDRSLRAALVQHGLLEALVARFDVIVPLPRLTAAELAQVLGLVAAPTGALLESLGGKLEIAPDGAAVLGAAAEQDADGAYALLRPLARISEQALFDAKIRVRLDRALAEELTLT